MFIQPSVLTLVLRNPFLLPGTLIYISLPGVGQAQSHVWVEALWANGFIQGFSKEARGQAAQASFVE